MEINGSLYAVFSFFLQKIPQSLHRQMLTNYRYCLFLLGFLFHVVAGVGGLRRDHCDGAEGQTENEQHGTQGDLQSPP